MATFNLLNHVSLDVCILFMTRKLGWTPCGLD
jgi:hypothetical protein